MWVRIPTEGEIWGSDLFFPQPTCALAYLRFSSGQYRSMICPITKCFLSCFHCCRRQLVVISVWHHSHWSHVSVQTYTIVTRVSWTGSVAGTIETTDVRMVSIYIVTCSRTYYCNSSTLLVTWLIPSSDPKTWLSFCQQKPISVTQEV